MTEGELGLEGSALLRLLTADNSLLTTFSTGGSTTLQRGETDAASSTGFSPGGNCERWPLVSNSHYPSEL